MAWPSDGLLPKQATQAWQFVQQQPAWDGRGTLVAVLDTGIDPGAKGLQRCPDGGKKLVGLLDTSGGGDVDTSKVVRRPCMPGTALTLTGLSKRELLLPDGLDNPDGEWHLGLKAAWELMPKELCGRLAEDRKRTFGERHAAALLAARGALDVFDLAHKSKTLARAELLERQELKARVEVLEAASNEKDLGSVCDCVVYRGGDGVWRALVDTSCTGDLRAKKPLRTFAAYPDSESAAAGEREFEFELWDSTSNLNYCVNVEQDGNLLSVVCDSGAHGTHVASILGGYHAGEPELDGVAPGCRIVSMKIGDGRLAGMETGAAIIRALNACAAMGVDIINMSFGEPTALPDMGRVADLCRELVEKHGVIFVSSAGNAGPALSTVGAPGSTGDALIGVGAYVEPPMMLAAYALKPGQTPPPNAYTWSSRGPAYDGLLGVTICAPGGAIAAVPQWTLAQLRLMNGTSMASPNAAGGIALLVSGLKQIGRKYSPWTIKRAIQATALPVPGVEPHAQGGGLIQVCKAFEALRLPSAGPHAEALYKVSIVSSEARTNAGPAKGIYIREPWESQPAGVREFVVSVEPIFPEPPKVSADRLTSLAANRLAYGFTKKDPTAMDVRVNVRCSQPWLSAPPFLHLNSTQKTFRVAVDLALVPTSASGSHEVPFGVVEAYDPNEPQALGPLWQVPVTAIRCESCELGTPAVAPGASVARLQYEPFKRYRNVPFHPGHIVRHFVAVPAGATWLDLELSPSLSSGSDGPSSSSTVPQGSSRTFYVHLLQMQQQSHYRADELEFSVNLRQEDGESTTRSMPVTEHGTVEICVAQMWSSMGQGPVDIEIRFSGVSVEPRRVSLGPSSGGFATVKMRADLGMIRVQPQAELRAWATAVRPTAAQTRLAPMPGGPRDAVLGAHPPESRPTYSLLLVYQFKQLDSGKVTARLPHLYNVLYESPLDSQMIMLFDADKRLLATIDAWPKPVEVPKGDITARVLLRHEDRGILEKFLEMPLVLERALASEIALTCHKTTIGAAVAAGSFAPRLLSRGETVVCTWAAPLWKDAQKKLPKGIAAGDVLIGSARYVKRADKEAEGTGKAYKSGSGYPVEWVVIAPPSSPATEPTLKADEPPKDTNPAQASSANEDKSSEDKGEEAPAVTAWKLSTEPAVKAKLKALEQLRKKKDTASTRELFESIATEISALLRAAISQLPPSEANLIADARSLETQLVRIRLLRAVHCARKFLDIPAPKANMESGKTECADDAAARAGVVQLCDSLIAALKPDVVLSGLALFQSAGDLDGVGESEVQKEARNKTQEARAWLVEALALKAYATRFAPNADLENLLSRIADSKDLVASQLRLDRHVYQGRYALALQVLSDKFAGADAPTTAALDALPLAPTPAALQDLRVALFDALGFTHVSAQVRSSDQLIKNPVDYAPF